MVKGLGCGVEALNPKAIAQRFPTASPPPYRNHMKERHLGRLWRHVRSLCASAARSQKPRLCDCDASICRISFAPFLCWGLLPKAEHEEEKGTVITEGLPGNLVRILEGAHGKIMFLVGNEGIFIM